LAITLAHQHLGQLSRDLRDGISTNARNKIFFTASPEDAHELARHTTPRVSEHDLAHLGAYHAAARLVLRGQQTEPFTIITSPLPPAIPGRAQQIRHPIPPRTRVPAFPTGNPPHPHATKPTTPSRPAPTDQATTPPAQPRIADPRRCA
ncbi:MAG: type VI secretion protein, partial [Actinobacteria bacterium]|nr:type VI secretion protein [Actinomycetota bacterium]